MVIHSTTNTAQVPNLVRSAIAPLIKATVMIANMSWKATNANSGMVPLTLSRPTLDSPTLPSPPSRPLATSVSKETLYPYSTHNTGTIARQMKLIMSMLRTFLERTIPP